MFKRKSNYETSLPTQLSKSLSKKEIMTIHQKRPGPSSQTAVETTYKTFYEYVFSTGIL
jgi:hypothetical protein